MEQNNSKIFWIFILGPFIFLILFMVISDMIKQVCVSSENKSTIEILDITLMERSEEGIGDETREIDNLASEEPMLRKVQVSREWSQKLIVTQEQIIEIKSGQKLDLSPLSISIEKALKNSYSISAESSQKKTSTEEVTVTVPARKKILLGFRWKQVWQHGLAKVRLNHGEIVSVPFKVLEEVTFDQRQMAR